MKIKELISKMKNYGKILAITIGTGYASPILGQNIESTNKDNVKEKTEASVNQHILHESNREVTTLPINHNLNELADSIYEYTLQDIIDKNHKIKLKFNELDSISAQEAIISPFVDYVIDLDSWQNNEEVKVKRVDNRCISTPDLASIMMMRECEILNDVKIKNGKIGIPESELPHNYPKKSYISKLLDRNNVNAAEVESPANINKSKNRCFICQANANIVAYAIRYMYCSNDSVLQNFAKHFIVTSPQNKNLVAEINHLIYENGELKLGAEAISDRVTACRKMKNLRIKGIGTNTRLSDNFIEKLTKYSTQFHKNFMDAEKDFTIGFYPVLNGNNIPAEKA